MILTSGATQKLQLVTSAAATIDVEVAGVDFTAPSTFTPYSQQTAITTATTTDILAPRGASVFGNTEFISVTNKHATQSCDVTLLKVGSVTVNIGDTITLAAGEWAMMSETGVWFVYDANGAVKNASSVNDPRFVNKELLADQSNATTTLTEVTGLSVTLAAGTYTFQYFILHQAPVATTGARFSVNYTGTVTRFAANIRFVDISATAATAAPDQDSVVATATVMAAFSARVKSTLGWGTTLSVDTINVDMLTIIEGVMVVSTAGDIELWHGAEVAATSTVKAGSMLMLAKAA